MPDNPLLSPWTGNAGLPPFSAIKPEHFRPAYDAEMAAQLAAVAAIAAQHRARDLRQHHRPARDVPASGSRASTASSAT